MNKDNIVRDNIRLIHRCVRGFVNQSNSSYDDYFGDALFAFAEAIDKYNPDSEMKFSTFAYKYMFGQIVNRIVTENRLKRGGGKKTISINSEEVEDHFYGLKDERIDVENEAINNIEFENFNKFLGSESPRRQYIMNVAFGINGYKEMTQLEIAETLGVSHQCINQTILKVIEKYKRKLASEEWEFNARRAI